MRIRVDRLNRGASFSVTSDVFEQQTCVTLGCRNANKKRPGGGSLFYAIIIVIIVKEIKNQKNRVIRSRAFIYNIIVNISYHIIFVFNPERSGIA